ncbi:hypothetical protein [Picosynechococcus sp. NKBG15041c]|uniref:hypothetical protein n=1 Tax=Picosynechococcus sp. NKBG15041c TaxID=1407650 RepID=UPI00041B8E0B|nr:hypothetical protein [Picosynechococcus sp. NKBG15041c]
MKTQYSAYFHWPTAFLSALILSQGAAIVPARAFELNQNLFLDGITSELSIPSSLELAQVPAQSCGAYGLSFYGPLESTPYQSILDGGSLNPGPVYVIFSTITPQARPTWTQNNGTWEAAGPFELRGGKGYLLEFGPQTRQVRMIEGPLPYYVEGTASWVQLQNTDTFRNSYAYCIIPAHQYTGAGQHNSPTASNSWQGTLTPSSQVFNDGTFYNSHSFTGQAGETVEITLETQDFDGLLILVNPQGEWINFVDEYWKGDPETITMQLPATGQYTVIVNSYEAGETGNYTLTLRKSVG